MPHGTVHDETGWLTKDGGSFALRREEGGTWRLDVGFRRIRRARSLLGCQVRVVGTRVDFDVLEVERLNAIEDH